MQKCWRRLIRRLTMRNYQALAVLLMTLAADEDTYISEHTYSPEQGCSVKLKASGRMAKAPDEYQKSPSNPQLIESDDAYRARLIAHLREHKTTGWVLDWMGVCRGQELDWLGAAIVDGPMPRRTYTPPESDDSYRARLIGWTVRTPAQTAVSRGAVRWLSTAKGSDLDTYGAEANIPRAEGKV